MSGSQKKFAIKRGVSVQSGFHIKGGSPVAKGVADVGEGFAEFVILEPAAQERGGGQLCGGALASI